MNYSIICIQCVTTSTENSGAITTFNNQQLERKELEDKRSASENCQHILFKFKLNLDPSVFIYCQNAEENVCRKSYKSKD